MTTQNAELIAKAEGLRGLIEDLETKIGFSPNNDVQMEMVGRAYEMADALAKDLTGVDAAAA